MEENPELQKLLKLKEALKSDLEKKTGKKIEPKEEKKQKIQLSEDLRKRIASDGSVPLNIEEIRTPLDIEKTCAEIQCERLYGYAEKNADQVRDKLLAENLKLLITMLKGRPQEAIRHFERLYVTSKSDFVYFNLLLAELLAGNDVENGVATFLAEQSRSAYPLLMMLFFSLFRYKNFQIVKKTIPLLLKTEPNELHALFFQMLQMDDKEISKYCSILYRKNEYREFQNIAKLLPYFVNKDGTNYQYTLDALNKKDAHHCSRLYYEYITRENALEPAEAMKCPLGLYLAGRTAIQNNDCEKAREYAKRLNAFNDPYGGLLTVALKFGAGKGEEAIRLLHELLLPFERVIVTWLSGRQIPCKGVGTLTNVFKKNTIIFPIAADFEQFQQIMTESLAVWDDFEVFLYPYEELRCFFGARLCTLAYKEKK